MIKTSIFVSWITRVLENAKFFDWTHIGSLVCRNNNLFVLNERKVQDGHHCQDKALVQGRVGKTINILF